MAAIICPKHGHRIALIFCDHAGAAVDERRDVPVYQQRVDWCWMTVCKECMRSPDLARTLANVGYLVCTECAIEWAELTKNRFVERCQAAEPEFPEGVTPVPPERLSLYGEDERDSRGLMVSLRASVYAALKGTPSTRDLVDIVRSYQEVGLMQPHAYEALAAERALSADEAAERIRELMDIVAGHCAPDLRIWPEPMDTKGGK